MAPSSDKVRSLTPTWLKLAYEAPPALCVGGRVGPCLEDWAREGSCVDQCDDEVWHVGIPAGLTWQRVRRPPHGDGALG
jgi:hypothetical protein